MRTPRKYVKWSKSGQPARLFIFITASVLILVFSLLAPAGVGLFDKIGMELALIAAGLFLSRFPIGIFLSANLFILSAAAGSVLRFYDQFPGYDRVVHFMSGIILGYVGFYLGKWLFDKCHTPGNPVPLLAFSFLFSCAGAGFWEIIEFTTDCITHMGVQHGNTDTMGDIVAGFAGALCFAAVTLYQHRHAVSALFRLVFHRSGKKGEKETALAIQPESAEQRGH